MILCNLLQNSFIHSRISSENRYVFIICFVWIYQTNLSLKCSCMSRFDDPLACEVQIECKNEIWVHANKYKRNMQKSCKKGYLTYIVLKMKSFDGIKKLITILNTQSSSIDINVKLIILSPIFGGWHDTYCSGFFGKVAQVEEGERSFEDNSEKD